MNTLIIQKIVNAQVEVNRAVFEVNQANPRTEYLEKCIEAAMADLSIANVLLKNAKAFENLQAMKRARKRSGLR